MSASVVLATAVRNLRTARQWTLDHAAVRIGISRRLLAQIEAGEANPSLTTLLALADGFGVHLTDLLEAPSTGSTTVVQTDPATAPVLWSTSAGSAARLLVGRGPLELWHWFLAPGDSRMSEAHSDPSAEMLHVLSGTVELEIGEEVLLLKAGASAAFPANRVHTYRNPTRRPATFLLTVHDPTGS